MNNIKEMFKGKRIRIAMLMLLDVIVLFMSSFLAIALRFDFANIPELYVDNIFTYFIIDALILIACNLFYRIYQSMWSYASIMELIYIGFASLSYTIIEAIYKMLLHVEMPKSYYLIKFILLVILIASVRYAYRIARTIKILSENRKKTKNTMIIGAGEAGRLLINEIGLNPNNFDNKVVCIIDDNKNKIGTFIRGIQVVGDRHTISENCEKYNIE